MQQSSKPLPQHFNDFLDWLEIEKGLSNKSQENYARFLKKFSDWLKIKRLDTLLPHQITPEHIRKYRIYLARQCSPETQEPLKKTTQNYYLIALRSFLNFFADRDITSLPSEKVKLAKDKDVRKVSFLSLEQIEKLFAAPNVNKIQELRDRAILEMLFSTGMRIAELTSLNREQVNIKPDTKQLEIVIVGKGSRPRPVYLSERAIYWLKRYLSARQDKEKPLFINYRSKKGSVRRLTSRSIQKSIKKYAIIAGVPLTTTPHVMRHSFSTDLLNQGVDLRILQEFLGHKSIAATQIYTHVTNKKLREVHRKFHSGKELKM
jgi:site-specific recombinase XerD